MKKKVIDSTALQFTPDFPGLQGVTLMARQFPIEPFLVFTEFRMDRPVFGPHPHAGISVMTYLLPDSEGSFINRDSQGDFSNIEPGGLHITQAGSGIHHDEFPKVTGVEVHGFQIWINHHSKNRNVAPRAMHANAHEIPEIATPSYRVRIVLGTFANQSAPHKLVTDISLLHVFLNPLQMIEVPVQSMAFLYGLRGVASCDGAPLSAQRILNFEEAGDSVMVEAGRDGVEFIVGTGTPIQEPIVYGGPFVMTTEQQMLDIQARYRKGGMGHLDKYKQ
jgi:quercetin 2,3-dioxygenase